MKKHRARKSDRIYAETGIDVEGYRPMFTVTLSFKSKEKADNFFSAMVDHFEMNAIAEWSEEHGGQWLERDTKWAQKHMEDLRFNENGEVIEEMA